MQLQPKSIYCKIYEDIKRQILQGKLKPGDRLPSEAELENIYGVSRAPVRQALSMLEQEVFLIRCQGRGTFVCDRKKESFWLLSSGFSKDLERDFDHISSKTLWVCMEKPDDELREALMLDEDRQVIHIHRLRYFKDTPIFSIHNYIRDSLNIETFQRTGDFFIISEILERDFQITLYRAEEEIRAAAADAEIAEEMQVPIGFPLLKMKRTYYTENDNAVYVSRYHVRTDYWPHRTTYSINK